MVNMTIASMNMMMGILPDGALSYALEQAARSIQTFAPSATPVIDALLAGKKDFDYSGSMTSIHDLKARLAQVTLSCEKASLLHAELENTLRIAEFAEKVHYLNAAGVTMSAEEKTALIAEIKALGEQILSAHPALWISRNRLHGLEDSVANFQKILK